MTDKAAQYSKVIEDLKRALKTFPDDPKFHFALASACFMAGRYDEAWRHGREAERYGYPDLDEFFRHLSEKSPEPEDNPLD